MGGEGGRAVWGRVGLQLRGARVGEDLEKLSTGSSTGEINRFASGIARLCDGLGGGVRVPNLDAQEEDEGAVAAMLDGEAIVEDVGRGNREEGGRRGRTRRKWMKVGGPA